MASEWRTTLLDDLSNEITVGHVGPMASEYVDEGVPFLRSLNVDALRISVTDIRYITSEFHARLHKSRLSPGDVVIVRTGKPGACAVIPEWLGEANCSDLVIVRSGPELNPKFLAYYINAVAHTHISAHLVGAVQQHFNVGSAKEMPVRHPPLDIQNSIVDVLGTLDDKIELNRRMNGLLEGMARAIFKAWFIDFEPVQAKAAGAARFPGMPQPVFDQLPAAFVNSELGAIPEGWEIVSLSRLVKLLGGGTPKRKKPEYWEGNIPWFSVRDAPAEHDAWVIDTEERITESGVANSSAKIMREGTTIISARGTVGRLALTAVPMTMNQSCYGVQGTEGVGDFFVYFMLRDAVDELRQRTHGSVFDTITRKTFDTLHRVRPEKQIIAAFEDVVTPFLHLMRSNLLENRMLSQVRDALLPKLISGKLSAARAVEGAA